MPRKSRKVATAQGRLLAARSRRTKLARSRRTKLARSRRTKLARLTSRRHQYGGGAEEGVNDNEDQINQIVEAVKHLQADSTVTKKNLNENENFVNYYSLENPPAQLAERFLTLQNAIKTINNTPNITLTQSQQHVKATIIPELQAAKKSSNDSKEHHLQNFNNTSSLAKQHLCIKYFLDLQKRFSSIYADLGRMQPKTAEATQPTTDGQEEKNNILQVLIEEGKERIQQNKPHTTMEVTESVLIQKGKEVLINELTNSFTTANGGVVSPTTAQLPLTEIYNRGKPVLIQKLTDEKNTTLGAGRIEQIDNKIMALNSNLLLTLLQQ